MSTFLLLALLCAFLLGMTVRRMALRHHNAGERPSSGAQKRTAG
jgi:hypothetical protein